MNKIIEFFTSINPILAAFIATSFTWFVTALGASLVFFFKKMNRAALDGMLGFTGGVMIAASVWSLIIPAFEHTESKLIQLTANRFNIANTEVELSMMQNFQVVLPVIVGILIGATFLFVLDKNLPHLHINFPTTEKEGIKTNWHKTTLLILAITLHNIPEGLAVGVLFGAAANAAEANVPSIIAGAVTLALGIGIQNFPEGIAVAMPLRRQGVSRFKSFQYGQLSAIVEPIAGVLGALAVSFFEPLLPYALAFAAGAMIYVVVEEVIPETQRDKYTDIATIGFIIGFIVMMSLDVMLS